MPLGSKGEERKRGLRFFGTGRGLHFWNGAERGLRLAVGASSISGCRGSKRAGATEKEGTTVVGSTNLPRGVKDGPVSSGAKKKGEES